MSSIINQTKDQGQPLIRAMAFDFDGVLADSVPVKDDALVHLFADCSRPVREAALREWLALKGVFRDERIGRVFAAVSGRVPSEEEVAGQSREFARQVLARTIAAPAIPGVGDFLAAHAHLPKYIVSRAPHQEVLTVAQGRHMAHHFKDIHGGPRPKAEILRDICAQEAIAPAQLLFIGDSRADLTAAREVSASFLGIVGAGLENPFPAGTPTATDFLDPRAWVAGVPMP